MNEKNTNTILTALAETIESLQAEVRILKFEKKQLEERLEIFTAPTQEVRKDA